MSTDAAAATCAFHPDRPASTTCANCGQQICLGCETTVAAKAVCQRCVAAIRAQIAGQMPSSAVAPAEPPVVHQQANVYPQSGAYQPYVPPPVVGAVPETMHAGHILGGLALGFVAGILSTIAWVVLVWATHFNIAFCAVGVGILIGVATTKGAGGRGGNVVAVMSAVIAFICCGIGALLTLSTDAYGIIFALICLFYGVRRAYITPMRAAQSW